MGFFTTTEKRRPTAEEFERLRDERDYWKNRVRQLEGRPYLVQRGTEADGSVIWGTPAHGVKTVAEG